MIPSPRNHPHAQSPHTPDLHSRYAELCVATNFTFLTGASHPEELVTRAAGLGLAAIAITDRNSLAGVVRAYRALQILTEKAEDSIRICSQHKVDSCSRQEIGTPQDIPRPHVPHLPKLIVGCRLVLRDSAVEWVALPTDKPAYQRLTQLLTLGKRRAGKGGCHLDLADILDGCDGMILIALPAGKLHEAADAIAQVRRRYPGHVFTGAAPRYDGLDQDWLNRCACLASRTCAPMVAVGDVLMHRASRRQLADVLACMRLGCTIDQIGRNALPNAERRLKGAVDMERVFSNYPAALRRTVEIANRCAFDLGQLSYDYPDEISDNETPMSRLTRLAEEGMTRRYPNGPPERARKLMAKELAVVEELNFPAYFLTVHDIIQYARSQDILCQGRGSAANSILCYLLGITDVAPEMIGMVFERFVSRHRGEPPDIDVDFEHERREEVIQWIYAKYGRHRAGLCATVIHFRSRAAIREVGKVMGLSQDVTAGLSGQIWGSSSDSPNLDRIRELGLDPRDRRLMQTLRLIGEIIGFPRHLSQHVGGFVITKGRLDELVPIENAAMENRTVIEWDKDDIDTLKILKIDVLGLGMLTCIRKAFELLETHERLPLTLATVPSEDRATYEMLQVADAVGVFQVESRAQMNFLPRMKPNEFYDLVIEVAIVRPGPIQGGMVQPYIRRRQGLESPEPFGPALEEVTRRTLGVPLFQEQALQIAEVGAGYTAEEADKLRRSLASFRRMGTIGEHRDKFISGMMANGYSEDVSARCFGQIEGFADYGFPESHAAAFALLVYVSAWLKRHHPAIFACALLNSQPMGFYAPAQIVRDAREHHVEIRPICVNHSAWNNTLERRVDGTLSLRLGFRQIRGFRQEDAEWIAAARGNGYRDPEAIWLRAGVGPAVLERLAEADAFTGMGLNRRDALWQVRAIHAPSTPPLFNDPVDGETINEPAVSLPQMHLGEEVVEDYVATRLTLRAHPMELLRPFMPGLTRHDALVSAPLRRTAVCGLVITRQRPGTASGVVFLTLEDETGVSNIVVWRKVFEQNRRAVMGGRLLRVTGTVQREGIVVHLIAEVIEDVSHRLSDLGHPLPDTIVQTTAKTDNAPRSLPSPRAMHPRDQAKRLFPSRDFH
ncbi:error-prone DNA polymerase [Qingshengfaniella alkalisoli]|uniref:Error-prone DNA polymerase n=1 Tax=Qingshengfaniella alkalisoli TaxID=2599296 RepID=A0A5B8IUU8_9RHOB|nr:error-prone DNA polymerase [Qingshengfaniella alkalisoli]QDY68238.1 DNA polymerase III subunit alpha [Qingshengfaniella alkalisoli]